VSRDRVLSEIVAMAEELCDTHRHTEPIYDTDKHRNRKLTRAYTTTQDGLLKQMREVAAEGLKVGETTRSGGKPCSKPPGVFDALSAHVYIAVESERWCESIGIDPRRTPEDSIRGLVGKASNLEDLTLSQLHREIKFWHGQASVLTGWRLSPYTPPVPCPNCKRQGSLRVNLENRSAFCSNGERRFDGTLICGVSWSTDGIVELGNYVRRMTEDAVLQAA
jgi:hypothetical protein